jgi:RNAse (barnase) inhibitor barstar
MTPFSFGDSNLPPSSAVVDVRAGIQTKKVLLRELAQALRFPDHVGSNWDALEECIRDLSWLPPGTIVLRHHDLPLRRDVASQRMYLSILRDTVGKAWTVPGRRLRDLVVVFPEETKNRVDRLLRLAPHDP